MQGMRCRTVPAKRKLVFANTLSKFESGDRHRCSREREAQHVTTSSLAARLELTWEPGAC